MRLIEQAKHETSTKQAASTAVYRLHDVLFHETELFISNMCSPIATAPSNFTVMLSSFVLLLSHYTLMAITVTVSQTSGIEEPLFPSPKIVMSFPFTEPEHFSKQGQSTPYCVHE